MSMVLTMGLSVVPENVTNNVLCIPQNMRTVFSLDLLFHG